MIGLKSSVSGSRRARRERAGFALSALLFWVVGAELLPGAHLAFHASLAAHTHDGGATNDLDASRCHSEDGAQHCHRAPRQSRLGWDRAADATPSARPLEQAHGAGSLAHRQLAFQRSAPALAPIAAAPFVELDVLGAPAPQYAYVLARAPQTRGPPT